MRPKTSAKASSPAPSAHAHHDGSKERFAAYRFDQDLESWLGRVKSASAADPEPVLSEV